MSGKKEKKHFIVGIIMVAIIVAATATMIYCYINRFDPQKGETYPYGMNDSTELFEKAGNIFISYVEKLKL